MNRLKKIGGHLVDIVANYTPGLGAKVTKTGNFTSQSGPPYLWSAYTGMWGVYVPGNEGMTFTVSMDVYPAAFPAGTKWSWNITPDPDFTSNINGYLHVDYGNYDGSPGTITPRQVDNITTLTVDAHWTTIGDNNSGLLCEFWLATTAAPSGGFTKTHEIAFFPKLSAGTIWFVEHAVTVGAGYTDGNGVSWKVAQGSSATGEPYYSAYRPDYSPFEGPFRFRDLLTYLKSAGKITGSEWFNGVAFGVEPLNGASTLTINNLGVTYTGT